MTTAHEVLENLRKIKLDLDMLERLIKLKDDNEGS